MGAHPSRDFHPYVSPPRWVERTTTTSIEVLNPRSSPRLDLGPVPAARLPVEVRMAVYRLLFHLGERRWVRRELVRTERTAAEAVRSLLFQEVVTTSVRGLRRWAVAASEAGEAVRYQTRSLACLSDASAFSSDERGRARKAALFDHLAGPRRLAEAIPLAPLQLLPRLTRLVLQCPPPLPLKSLEELVFGTELSGAACGDNLWDEEWNLSRLVLIGPRMVLRPASLLAIGKLPKLQHLTLALPGLARGWTPGDFLSALLDSVRARAFPSLRELILVLHLKRDFVGSAPRWLEVVPSLVSLAQWRFSRHSEEEEELEDTNLPQSSMGYTKHLTIRLVLLPDEGEPVGYYNRYLFARAVKGASAEVDNEWGIHPSAREYSFPIRVLPLHRVPQRAEEPTAPEPRVPENIWADEASPREWVVNPALLRHLSEADRPEPVPSRPMQVLDQPVEELDLGFALARMNAPVPPDPSLLNVELELA